MSKEIKNIDTFKKSIESTIRAISNKKDITIFFGSTDNTTSKDVNLPEIDKDNNLKKQGYYKRYQ